MSRPKAQAPLVRKIAQAFKALGKLERRGTNTKRRYKYPRAADVFQLVRRRLLDLGVLILPSEEKAEYVTMPTNGGEQLTECRLYVTFLITDGEQSLPAMPANGVGRDVEDKALYKAKTGAEKYLVKQLALMVEIVDDPEWDGEGEYDAAETLHDAPAARVPNAQKPVTIPQIRAFNDACASTQKTQPEILQYLYDVHQVTGVKDLRRGKPFTEALRWANSNGASAPAPKPVAAPALQSKMFPAPAPSTELKIGNKSIEIPAQKNSFAL